MTFSLAGIVRKWAESSPERPMLTYQGRTVTWGEHHERSNRVAAALLAAGVCAEDRVALIDKNGLQYFEVVFGAAKINAAVVAVNWRLQPAEMVGVINDAEPAVLFVGSEFLGHVASFEHELATVRTIVVFDRAAGDEGRYESYEAWLEGRSAEDPGVLAAPEDVALQLYTSGTTGLPKGAMLTNTNLGVFIAACAKELAVDSSAVSMVALPLFHIGGSGWAFLNLSQGAQVVLIREVDPVAVLGVVEQHRITHAFLAPAVIMLLLGEPACQTTDFSTLRCMAYGASPISETLLSQARATFGCQFVQLYGLTEATGGLTVLRSDQHDPDGPHPERMRSCGVPFAHVELRVVDVETGEDQSVGHPGELWTRSAQNMKGYWHNPVATSAAITTDGWLKTGDVAYVDRDGFVYMHDRVKDMIVSGGENIYPAEVENALMAHPAISDVAVIGVPSEKWGESVKAMVVATEGATVCERELIDFARARIAHYKCPSSVDFVDVLPRNPSGKVLKRELRDPFWAQLGRRIQ